MIDWAFALLLMHHRSPIDWAVTRKRRRRRRRGRRRRRKRRRRKRRRRKKKRRRRSDTASIDAVKTGGSWEEYDRPGFK
jgi:hypothetical protein